MTVIQNKRLLKYLLLMVVGLLLVLGVSIWVSASSGYDRQEADACIIISERLSVETSYGKSSPNSTKPRGWKVGDPIDNLTRVGKEPSWSTVRSRYWKNEAYYNSGNYSEANLARMQKGKATIDIETGVSMIVSNDV